MRAPDYESLATEYKRCLAASQPLPRERYTVRLRVDGPDAPERELEWIAIAVYGWGAQVVALDPELDPRKALRIDGLRGVSLSNYLNQVVAMARPGLPTGPGSYRWIPLRSGGALPYGLEAQVDFERQGVILAHDFRPSNPERQPARVQAAAPQFALLWLETGWVLSGRVFNFESSLGKGLETQFVSVQAPRAYGDAARLPWGRGLPFLAVNRKYLVGFKCAQAREELERFLLAAPECQPRGFAPEELAPQSSPSDAPAPGP